MAWLISAIDMRVLVGKSSFRMATISHQKQLSAKEHEEEEIKGTCSTTEAKNAHR